MLAFGAVAGARLEHEQAAGGGMATDGERIAFLSNSWLEGDEWGPFHRSLIDILGSASDQLLVVRANSFVHPWSDEPLSPMHLGKLIETLREFEPTIVFSTNRAGLSGAVVAALPPRTRIVTLFIDFYDRVPETLKQFTERDFVWGTGTGWLRDRFVERYGGLLSEDQIEFTLWASDTTVNYPRGLERDLDVLFVGSPLQHGLAAIVDHLRKLPRPNLEIFLETYFEHRRAYVQNLTAELARRGFDFAAVEEQPFAGYLTENWILQSFISDQISAEVRLRYLSALADFDLHLYGEPEGRWIEFISIVNAHLLKRYHFRPVKDPAELPMLYNRAKIGLNIQHHHAADVGLSMRVFDILACEALLLTHEITVRPLEELGFNADVDFVTFRSATELREKARGLLEDDARREEIARSGSRKLHESHSLTKRLVQVFRRAGYPALADRLQVYDRSQVDMPSAPVRYVSDPGISARALAELERPRFEKQRFPRTPGDVRAVIGRMLPDRLVDIDARVFRNWFLTVSLRRDASRGGRV